MLHHKATHFKAIEEKDAFNFNTKVNALLDVLNKKGIKPEMSFNHNMGHCVYITWVEAMEIPETVRDEYEQVGEWHKCIECPHFVRPTDGRRKYTRCPITEGLTDAGSNCCDRFYEELDSGKIKLIEVG